jgi:hypothetical protein
MVVAVAVSVPMAVSVPVAVSVFAAVSIFVAIVEFRFGPVAVIVVAFIFSECGARKQSKHDYGSRNYFAHLQSHLRLDAILCFQSWTNKLLKVSVEEKKD